MTPRVRRPPTSSLSAEARLRLRRDALRAALARGRGRDAAWAAARSRLRDIGLDPADARAARLALVRFGHALRSARRRRVGPDLPPAPRTAARSVGEVSRRREVRGWIAAGLVVLAIGAVVWSWESARRDDAGAAPAVAAATTAPPIRGRSQQTAAPVVAARAPAAAEPSPNASPAPSDAVASGGVPGGTGTSRRVVPAVVTIIPPEPTATPRPTPTATPTPTPVVTPSATPSPAIGADGLSHVSGRVVDTVTGRPLANVLVCIANGDASCTRAPRTDQDGRWTITLMPATSWSINFIANGYATSTQRVAARLGAFLLPDIRLARF